MSEETNIDLMLSSVLQKDHRDEFYSHHQRTVVPSSTLFFELIEDGDDLNVEAFFNDEPLRLGGCHHHKNCKAAEFAKFLNESIAYPSTKQACQISNETSSEETI